jgi:hypothetical protein
VTAIKEKICSHFGKDCPIAIAIATAESGLRADAKGWNCMYGTKSTACKPEDRGRAWSVDCGIFQLNFRGLDCPPDSMNIDWNIEKAYVWKFKPSGWNPWSVCKNGTVACGL